MSVWIRTDLHDAFARQLRERGAALARGATAIGWKLGFGTPAALEQLQIDGPLLGSLLVGRRARMSWRGEARRADARGPFGSSGLPETCHSDREGKAWRIIQHRSA